jgi:hypothetical protein
MSLQVLAGAIISAALASGGAPDIKAPGTVRSGRWVEITLDGGEVVKRTERAGDNLIVVLRPSGNGGQHGVGTRPRSPFAIAAVGEVIHITFLWPAFDKACSADHCIKIRWHVNRRVDITVCAQKMPSGKLDACDRATATLRP